MEYITQTWLKSLFQGRRVLVTGHTGFKGSWLSLWLHDLGAKVTGFALAPVNEEDHFNCIQLSEMIDHRSGDIRDFSSIKSVFESIKPEIVFHLAAQPLVIRSYDEPRLTLETNIGGTVNVLEAIRQTSSVQSFICVTSDKCYRNKEWVWGYREIDELGGDDPYSASKAASEIVFHTYLRSFFEVRDNLGAASVRAGNVIGGGDWSDNRIVPDCIKELIRKQPIVLRNPLATRPWQHVLEPLSGYLLLAGRLLQHPKKFSGSWNFAPNLEAMRTVHDLAATIVRYWGSGDIHIQQQDQRVHEAGLLHLCCDKVHNELRWQARWNFDRTIQEVIRWYKGVYDGQSALALSRQQISDYISSGQEDKL